MRKGIGDEKTREERIGPRKGGKLDMKGLERKGCWKRGENMRRGRKETLNQDWYIKKGMGKGR